MPSAPTELPGASVPSDPAGDDPAVVGDRIGSFELLEVLGRGGMGTVFRARRIDGGFEQEVAIKLMSARLISSSGLRDPLRRSLHERFLRERQILAQLEHPNISRLLEGGLSDDDQPYFAMELVDGEPITEYCERTEAGLSERLQLIAQAAAAVQFAHSRLVVHRDLKPSNLLVHRDGTLKLLDFGIARVLEATGEESVDGLRPGEATRLGSGLTPHTPDYASPEQLRGEPATVASDVYSLGVVLYELLVGERPESEDVAYLPAAPSRRRSGRVPYRLEAARHWREDLDAVVLQALHPEPAERYATADALSQDLLALLDGRPVAARRLTNLGKFVKLIRRHRVASLSLAVAVGFLLIGLATATWQARVASGQRDLARQQTEQARRSGEESEALADFLMDLFELSDPNKSQGEPLAVRDVLSQSARRVAALDAQPHRQAQLRLVLGELERKQGRAERARELFEQVLGQRAMLSSEELIQAHDGLGRVAYDQGLYGEAEGLHERSVGLAARGADVSQEASSLVLLSRAVRAGGDYVRAEQLARTALGRLGDGERDLVLSQALEHLGVALYLQERYEPALAHYEDALSIRLERLGTRHVDVAAIRNRIGLLEARVGRLQEAEAALSQAYDIYRLLLGDSHLDTLMVTGSLAKALARRGEGERAVALSRFRVERLEEVAGPDHPDLATALVDLASLLAADRHEESLELQRRALAIWRKVHGDAHPYVALAHYNCSRVLRLLGRYREAVGEARAAITVSERTQVGASQGLRYQAELAVALRRVGELQEAEAAYLELLELSAAAEPPSVRYLAAAHVGLVLVSADLGACSAAADWFGQGERWFVEVVDRQPHYLRVARESVRDCGR